MKLYYQDTSEETDKYSLMCTATFMFTKGEDSDNLKKVLEPNNLFNPERSTQEKDALSDVRCQFIEHSTQIIVSYSLHVFHFGLLFEMIVYNAKESGADIFNVLCDGNSIAFICNYDGGYPLLEGEERMAKEYGLSLEIVSKL